MFHDVLKQYMKTRNVKYSYSIEIPNLGSSIHPKRVL